MLDAHNASVLSYARLAADDSSRGVAQHVGCDPESGARAQGRGGEWHATDELMANPASITDTGPDHGVTLPPFAAWVAQVGWSPQRRGRRGAGS